MTLRLTIAMCLVAVFSPAAMAQFGFDDESSVSETAAVVSDRGFGADEVLEPLQPLRTTIDPVLPALRPMVEPDIDAASDVDALIESCGFQPQVARAYRAAEIADADEDCPEYLGRLSANPYAADSTANPYSTAGSPYSSKSVNNQFGPYGSPFLPTSARNPYATDAPKIVAQDGTYLGELSDNPYDPDSVANPYGRYGSPYSPRSARNPLATDAPRIVAEDGTYLGELSANSYDPDSISNPFGRYGSPYSSTSIRNPYSPYGSPYSSQSPNNPYTARAPLLFGQ